MQTIGRTVIYCAEEKVNKGNISSIVTTAYTQHLINKSQIQTLYDFWRGDQLHKKKKIVRKEIDNKIIENHAYEIVAFKKGYGFSDPIQYVTNGSLTDNDGNEKSNDDVSKNINTLNEYMMSEDKTYIDGAIAEWCLICGLGYRMTLPKQKIIEGEAPFEMESCDPRYNFVIYSNGFKKRPLVGVQVVNKVDILGAQTQVVEKLCCYTSTHYYEIVNGGIVKEEEHALGYIPLVEYRLNDVRAGAFEPVIDLLEGLNKLTSNRVDGVEQFVQSIIKFLNCDIEEKDISLIGEMGAIKVKSENGVNADVEILSSELDQQQVQTLVEDMYQNVLIICGMPDRKGNGFSGGDTGQAVILRDGWGAAEAMMKDYETVFKSCETEFLKQVLLIVEKSTGLKINLRDIAIKFSRNRTDNILTKSQSLTTMLNANVAPRIAFNISGLFSDPESAYLESKPYLEAALERNSVEVQKVQQTVGDN